MLRFYSPYRTLPVWPQNTQCVSQFFQNEKIGELLLEWEGLQARIIRPDVQAVNGVIHVIDRVMMKRRDLTKSGSPTGPRCTGFLLFILALVQVAILF
ncbi:UNVERIFIED_CONTAM: hypothetical protein NCL1_21021 [Trichonephila clavipes]